MNLTLEQFAEFARRFRSRELSALKAENLLMRIALEGKRGRAPVICANAPAVIYKNLKSVDAVRAVVNGEAMGIAKLREAVAGKFPQFECTSREITDSLSYLFRRKEVTRTGERHCYRYLKALATLVVLLPLLFGCRTTPEPIPSAIMPRRLPDAPRPAYVAPAPPTTASVSLAWERVPGALTYRVDYGTDSMTNSLMTQATDCTIRGLELGRVYHYNVRACDGRTYGPVFNVVIK